MKWALATLAVAVAVTFLASLLVGVAAWVVTGSLLGGYMLGKHHGLASPHGGAG